MIEYTWARAHSVILIWQWILFTVKLHLGFYFLSSWDNSDDNDMEIVALLAANVFDIKWNALNF